MKENFKIEKELLFKNNIKDITSISLDSDYKIEQKKVLGHFLITGEYKIHEVSINREKFNFKIPFKYELESDIDDKTVNVEITNFEYDYNKDELMVNIEYDIIGDRKDVLIFDNEESLDDFLSKREVEVVDTRIEEIKCELDDHELKTEKKEPEEIIEEQKLDKTEEELKKDVEVTEDKIDSELTRKHLKEEQVDIVNAMNITNEIDKEDKVETEEIINNINTIEDGFITYKVYTIKENETLESIVVKYHTTIDELKEYNDLNNLSVNDKIIIPVYE